MMDFEHCGNCGEAMTSIRLSGLGVLFRLASDDELVRPNGAIAERFSKCSLCHRCWEHIETMRFGPGRTDAQGKSGPDSDRRPIYAYAVAELVGPSRPTAWSDFVVDGAALVFVPDAAVREFLPVATVVLGVLARDTTVRADSPGIPQHLRAIRLPDRMSLSDLLAAGDHVDGLRDAPPGLHVPDVEDDVTDIFDPRYVDDFGADSDGDIDIGMAGADVDYWDRSPGPSQAPDDYGDCTCRDRAYFSLSKGKRRCLRRRKADIRRTVTDPAAQKYAIDMAIARFRGIRSCTVHP
jgi:hypothetical protein